MPSAAISENFRQIVGSERCTILLEHSACHLRRFQKISAELSTTNGHQRPPTDTNGQTTQNSKRTSRTAATTPHKFAIALCCGEHTHTDKSKVLRGIWPSSYLTSQAAVRRTTCYLRTDRWTIGLVTGRHPVFWCSWWSGATWRHRKAPTKYRNRGEDIMLYQQRPTLLP